METATVLAGVGERNRVSRASLYHSSRFARPALALIAGGLLSKPWWLMLLSAVLAGGLMGLLTWMVTASRDTVGRIVVVWITTFVIGIAGLHHSIAGLIEVLTAIFARAGPGFTAFGTFASGR